MSTPFGNVTDKLSNDRVGSRTTDSETSSLLEKPSTIPIKLVIHQGFIYKYHDNATKAQLYSHAMDEKLTLRHAFQLPSSMTKKDFEAELERQFHEHFGIDVTAYRKENGGKGSARQMDCTIDVPGSGVQQDLTRVNLPNEETWEAVKGLMRVAKGDAVIEVTFAVQKGKLWERMLIRHFVNP
nr:hypothetical protein CFP56_50852 [Quercus suber]